MARTPRIRHLRHSQFDRVRRNDPTKAFVAERVTTLGATAAHFDFTTDVQASVGTLTLAGQPAQDDTISIGVLGAERVYTFRSVIEEEPAVGVLTLGANFNDGDEISIGTAGSEVVYTVKTKVTATASVGTLTNVANFNVGDQVSIGTTGNEKVYEFVTLIEAVKATATLTATAPPADGETVSIGARVYRYKNALAQADDVLTEVAATDALDNLIAAITLGAGGGVKYHAGTAANTDVTATAGAGDTMDVEALVAGVAGNSIALAETVTGDWSPVGFLENGKDEEAAYSVERGGNASDSLDNLIAAINAGAGAGTVYGTGTVAHAEVGAAAGAGDTVTITADVAGVAGDSINTTVPVGGARGDFAAATLGGGKDEEAAYSVQRGAAATNTIDNLIAAITYDGGAGTNEGVLYGTGTVAHTEVEAAVGAGDTMGVTALTAGVVGNDITTTVPVGAVRGDFTDATLLGGVGAESADTIEISAVSASATCDNIIAAINAAAGAGATYGTGTVVNADVSAAAGAGDTVVVTARTAGLGGDSILVDKAGANLGWDDTHLNGGVTSNNCETAAPHGLVSGAGPFTFSTTGSAPGGLVANAKDYYVDRVDASNFTLRQGRKGATIAITADGTGTQTITKGVAGVDVYEEIKEHGAKKVKAATDIDAL